MRRYALLLGSVALMASVTLPAAAKRSTTTTKAAVREDPRRLRGHLRREQALLRALAVRRRRVDDPASATARSSPVRAPRASACSGTRRGRTATSCSSCSSATTLPSPTRAGTAACRSASRRRTRRLPAARRRSTAPSRTTTPRLDRGQLRARGADQRLARRRPARSAQDRLDLRVQGPQQRRVAPGAQGRVERPRDTRDRPALHGRPQRRGDQRVRERAGVRSPDRPNDPPLEARGLVGYVGLQSHGGRTTSCRSGTSGSRTCPTTTDARRPRLRRQRDAAGPARARSAVRARVRRRVGTRPVVPADAPAGVRRRVDRALCGLQRRPTGGAGDALRAPRRRGGR